MKMNMKINLLTITINSYDIIFSTINDSARWAWAVTAIFLQQPSPAEISAPPVPTPCPSSIQPPTPGSQPPLAEWITPEAPPRVQVVDFLGRPIQVVP